MKTKIALDYDGTITTNHEAWKKAVAVLRSSGYEVHIVTQRYPEEVDAELLAWGELVDGLITTSRHAKKHFTLQMGEAFDIWIDDKPEAVHAHAHHIYGWSTPPGFTITQNGSDRPEYRIAGKLMEGRSGAIKIYNLLKDHFISPSEVADKIVFPEFHEYLGEVREHTTPAPRKDFVVTLHEMQTPEKLSYYDCKAVSLLQAVQMAETAYPACCVVAADTV